MTSDVVIQGYPGILFHTLQGDEIRTQARATFGSFSFSARSLTLMLTLLTWL